MQLRPEVFEIAEDAVDVSPGGRLIPEVMQRGREDPVAHQEIDRIGGIFGQRGKTAGVIEGGAELAGASEREESVERSGLLPGQLARGVRRGSGGGSEPSLARVW